MTVLVTAVLPTPGAAVEVEGDDAAEAFVGRGGLILPPQIDEITRTRVAACPDCLWRLASPCAQAPLGNAFDPSPPCLSVTRGCPGGTLRRTWFREGTAPWQEIGLVCLREDPVTVRAIGARVEERLLHHLPPLEVGHLPRQGIVTRVVEQVKELEAEGWSFEAADASFELLIWGSEGRELSFRVESWRTIVEQDAQGEVSTEATVKIHLDGERIISTAEGNGPVNALDRALRRAIFQKYPDLEGLRLVDYKVRILDEKAGTGARTRVLIGTSDGQDSWSTVGVHENVIAASWRALEDAVRYGLLRRDR